MADHNKSPKADWSKVRFSESKVIHCHTCSYFISLSYFISWLLEQYLILETTGKSVSLCGVSQKHFTVALCHPKICWYAAMTIQWWNYFKKLSILVCWICAQQFWECWDIHFDGSQRVPKWTSTAKGWVAVGTSKVRIRAAGWQRSWGFGPKYEIWEEWLWQRKHHEKNMSFKRKYVYFLKGFMDWIADC